LGVRVVWLLTGIPALAVFLFVPSGSPLLKSLGPLLFILELAYVQPVSDALIKVKKTTGSPLPIGGRLKLIPWACGVLIYIPIIENILTGEAKVLMGCLAVALCSISKVWIACRPFQGAPTTLP
jgi:hypothetical protein